MTCIRDTTEVADTKQKEKLVKRYLTNTITNAILRLDFANPIPQINDELDAKVRSECLKHFQIPEKRQSQNKEIQFNEEPGKEYVSVSHSTISEWCFNGKNSRKELKITQSAIIIDVQEYESFNVLKQEFLAIFKVIRDIYGELQLSRMGLRYIDQIEPRKKNSGRQLWDAYWKDYVDERLLGGLAFADNSNLAQQMNTCAMNYGEYSLTFQYGMFNPDFPAVAKKSVFVLDTDVYTAGLISPEDAVRYLDIFHDQASNWFESSITDNLRSIMDSEDDE